MVQQGRRERREIRIIAAEQLLGRDGFANRHETGGAAQRNVQRETAFTLSKLLAGAQGVRKRRTSEGKHRMQSVLAATAAMGSVKHARSRPAGLLYARATSVAMSQAAPHHAASSRGECA